MSLDQDKILSIIYKSIDDLNRQFPAELRLSKAPDTILIGDGGTLDSLGLITLIVSLEEALETATGQHMALLEEEALSDPVGPYHTVGSLVSWIAGKAC